LEERALGANRFPLVERGATAALKELESLKEIAGKIHELRVISCEGGLGALLPKGLLTASGEPKHGDA
jgi:hypothetical protein